MRYFIEVAYHGAGFAGFQVQKNAVTIQYELEKAFEVLLRHPIQFTGSSRTDAGVHARQNFFHFDAKPDLNERIVYNINAILPAAITIKSLLPMPGDAHCRFDAVGRLYKYYLYAAKNPFLRDRAWHYPYPLRIDILDHVAQLLLGRHDFTSFSKRKTQVKSMFCTIMESKWEQHGETMVYTVKGNRFLRGMVRGLVATMLMAGRGKISVQQFVDILIAQDCSKADFSAPAHGLFLEEVIYPKGYFENEE